MGVTIHVITYDGKYEGLRWEEHADSLEQIASVTNPPYLNLMRSRRLTVVVMYWPLGALCK